MKLELPQILKKLYKTGFVVDKKNGAREAINFYPFFL